MARRAFYSFHYDQDSWRASQVRNMGVVEGNRPVMDNDWEQIKRGGDKAVQKWIVARQSDQIRRTISPLQGAEIWGMDEVSQRTSAATPQPSPSSPWLLFCCPA